MNNSNSSSLSIEYKHPLSESFTLEDFADISVCINEPISPLVSSTNDKLLSQSCGNFIHF